MGFLNKISQTVSNILPFDPTPGFNLTDGSKTYGIPFVEPNKPAPGQSIVAGTSTGTAPSPARDDTGVVGGYYGYGSSVGASSAPTYDPNDLALIDQQIATTNSGLGRIGNQRGIGIENILNSYNESRNKLTGQKATAERDYNTKKTQTTQDYTNTRSGIRKQAGQQFTALQRLLGSIGAGRSSAAQVLAPFAAGRQASERFGEVQDAFGRNMQGLDTAYGDTNRRFTEEFSNLDAEKRRKENELNSGLAQNEASLVDQLAQLNLKRQQLLGGNLQNALSAIQPYRDRVNSLLDQIDNYGRQYQGSVALRNNIKYTAPELDQYNYSAFDNPALQQQTDPTFDYISPFGQLLKDREEQLV